MGTNSTDAATTDRRRGALVGMAVGDALGAAVEESFAEIARAAARQQPEPGRLETANA